MNSQPLRQFYRRRIDFENLVQIVSLTVITRYTFQEAIRLDV